MWPESCIRVSSACCMKISKVKTGRIQGHLRHLNGKTEMAGQVNLE